jgi:hypothetical protein
VTQPPTTDTTRTAEGLIADGFDFGSRRCIMSVAGDPGGQAIAIGLMHPHLQGIITGLEPVCRVATERIEANGLADRFTAEPADLIAGPYPDGADLILLGHVPHDWSDDSCLRILRNCAAALPHDGMLLVSESILGPDARERTTDEYRALLDRAGFELEEVIEMNAPRDLLVARKRK